MTILRSESYAGRRRHLMCISPPSSSCKAADTSLLSVLTTGGHDDVTVADELAGGL